MLEKKINRGYYTVARRYEFYFRVAKQYFTNERSEWVKYCFWWFSEDFRPPFEDFRRFSKIVLNTTRTLPNIFREFLKISEGVRRFPKTSEEDRKMFRWYTNEFKYNVRDKPDVIERSINSRVRLWKINHSGPRCSFYEFYEWYIFQ